MDESCTASGHSALDRWDSIINEIAPKFGIEPNLVKAHMEFESSGDPNILGGSGRGCGLMQIDYGTYFEAGRWRYSSVHGTTDAIFDPRTNILIACRDFLLPLKNAFPQNLDARIAGYNAGVSAVQAALDLGTSLTMVTFRPWYIQSVEGAFHWFCAPH